MPQTFFRVGADGAKKRNVDEGEKRVTKQTPRAKKEEEKWGNCSARERAKKRNKCGNADNGDGDPNACLIGDAYDSPNVSLKL